MVFAGEFNQDVLYSHEWRDQTIIWVPQLGGAEPERQECGGGRGGRLQHPRTPEKFADLLGLNIGY